MSTRRDPYPTGNLTLIDYFSESSSTHADSSHTVSIVASDSNNLLLTESKESNNMFQPAVKAKVSKWLIDRDELIRLVKKYGEPLPPH